ncbi:dTDP-rhamnosyl transferase [Lacticaseibacillus paracasei]|uniref:dTDP-rhamnosyl transferase n=1 Tax=Lacticaseibacillus paracasei TaxID=1597 RepID=UPI000C2D6658|nr:dTDP-rhamnosyl transferase [Lacticaseibacillus paracasei]AUC01303.1 dTDP-rhamnosyl transferase [Lacticaseibacillus paracasei subsp. paracasei]MDH7443010.1 dTDP-rhamnosyl transferase [Lacticaseibacillus paracasei subsp. paracasei]RND62452.1 hypothetical protein FAM18126_03004 [Lacticaseibacillus paracasei]
MGQVGHSYLIVLYKQTLRESMAYQGIMSQLTDNEHLIIYDNSPSSMIDVEDRSIIYHHDSSNRGLAEAYNFAITKCHELGDQLLTIFDQDTTVPSNFDQVVSASITSDSESAVFVPEVLLTNGSNLSPFWIEDSLFLAYPKKKEKTLAAINSGMTLNLDKFSRNAVLFPRDYPLDFLDYAFFKHLNLIQKTISVIPVKLVQSLSISNYHEISNNRFESFQYSEAKFVSEYYPTFKRQYRFRVLLRLIKQVLKRTQWSKLRPMIQVIGGKETL